MKRFPKHERLSWHARRPVRNHCSLFMGLGQDRRRTTGLEHLYYQVHEASGGWPNEVDLVGWRIDPKEHAAKIDRTVQHAGAILLVGYSWGCPTALRVAEWLVGSQRANCLNLVLLDPVGRGWPWRWLSSTFGRRVIRLPRGISYSRVWYAIQENDWPRGCRLREYSGGSIEPNYQAPLIKHRHMDELNAARDQILELVGRWR